MLLKTYDGGESERAPGADANTAGSPMNYYHRVGQYYCADRAEVSVIAAAVTSDK